MASIEEVLAWGLPVELKPEPLPDSVPTKDRAAIKLFATMVWFGYEVVQRVLSGEMSSREALNSYRRHILLGNAARAYFAPALN